jgi:UDPglucose 6-dehydrogenase
LRFLRKVEEALWVVRDKQVGVLGLAFKPHTDDIREAPSLDVLRWLAEQGARVKAYDPAAMDKVRALFPGVEYCSSAYQAAEAADAVLVITEWEEFATLDLARLRSLMRHPIVIDGRNVFSPADMAASGFEYYSVGRAPVAPGVVKT